MSKELLSQLAASKNLDEPTPEMKSAIALGLVIEFGLAAMEDYLEDLLDMDEDGEQATLIQDINKKAIDIAVIPYSKLKEDRPKGDDFDTCLLYTSDAADDP